MENKNDLQLAREKSCKEIEQYISNVAGDINDCNSFDNFFSSGKDCDKILENTKKFINLLSLEDLNLLNLEEISLGEGHIDILFEKSNLELFVTFGVDDIEYMTCLDNLDDDKYYYRNTEKIDYSNFIEIPKLLRKELDKIRNYGK